MAEPRDIAELDGLANEVAVCINKSDNYADTARQKIAEVATALDAGEFGEWTTNQWLLVKVGLEEERVPVYLPRPGELAKAMVQAHPEMSDRAIAKMIGAGNKTVSRQRATVSCDTVQPRVGLDGKERRVPVKANTATPAVVPMERQVEALQKHAAAKVKPAAPVPASVAQPIVSQTRPVAQDDHQQRDERLLRRLAWAKAWAAYDTDRSDRREREDRLLAALRALDFDDEDKAWGDTPAAEMIQAAAKFALSTPSKDQRREHALAVLTMLELGPQDFFSYEGSRRAA